LSALLSSLRELVAFTGPVQCEVPAGAVNLVLRGYARTAQGARGELTEVLFSDVGALTRELRRQLLAVQQGEAPDRHGWLARV